MGVFYQDDLVTLHKGDALAVLADLPDGSVDAVITDPPYSSGGATQSQRKVPTKAKYVRTSTCADFVGDARDQRAYQYWSTLWLSEALRIVKPGGLLMAFTDWRQYAATADAIQAGGWTWRGVVTWVKPPHATRPMKGRFTQPCEYVLWGTKGERAIDFKSDDPSITGWFEATAPRGSERLHVTEKPVDLMAHLMQLLPPGSTVLDPFCGSGTTGVAAKALGFRFVGVEQMEHYCELAARRLSQNVLDFGGAA